MGSTLRHVIFDVGGGIKDGRQFKAVQIGGPSGGCLPASLSTRRSTTRASPPTGAIMGSGGMVVADDTTCMVDLARYFLQFTQNESLRQVRALPPRHQAHAGDPGPHHPGRGRDGRHRDPRDAGRRPSSGPASAAWARRRPTPCSPPSSTSATSTRRTSSERRCPAHACTALIAYVIDAEACTGCMLCAKKCPVDAITGAQEAALRHRSELVHRLRLVPRRLQVRRGEGRERPGRDRRRGGRPGPRVRRGGVANSTLPTGQHGQWGTGTEIVYPSDSCCVCAAIVKAGQLSDSAAGTKAHLPNPTRWRSP